MIEEESKLNFHKWPMLFVKRDSPAAKALIRFCEQGPRPGLITFISAEEFEALKDDVMAVERSEERRVGKECRL